MISLKIIIICFLVIFVASQNCPLSYYFNGQRCAPCQQNCQCTQQNKCTKCLSGYAYDSTFTNCLPCPTAISGQNIGCKQCCSQIQSTAFVCAQCQSLPYVFMKGGQCIKIDGCSEMQDNGVCLSCVIGYYKYESKCKICHTSCKSCADQGYCLTCNTGYFNSTDITSYAYCQPCSLGCTTCTSSSSCSACLTNYLLNNAACVACPIRCSTCNQAGCLSCQTGSSLIGATCQACINMTYSGSSGCLGCSTNSGVLSCTSCDNGYLLRSGQCISCSSLYSFSILCNSTGPIQCLNDYVSNISNRYYLIQNQCVLNIFNCKAMVSKDAKCSECYFSDKLSLYYQLVNGACVKCSVSGCLKFSSSCACLSCQDGYQFINNQCVACQNLHCIKCIDDVRLCTLCQSGYGIFSSACSLCTKPNCQACNGDFNKCTTCLQGYYLDTSSSSCFKCQTSCLSCLSSIQCLTCLAGWYLTPQARCKQLPSNCVQINSKTGECTKCQYGYASSYGNCYECGLTLFNLNTCQKYCPIYYLQKKWQTKVVVSMLCMLIMIFIGFNI